MRKLKIYLDTSIVNFLYADDAPEYMAITKQILEKNINDYDVYISEVMFVEVNRTQDESRKELLLTEIAKQQLEVYDVINEDIEYLGNKYIEAGIIPLQKIDDAMHVAFATYY